MKLRGADIIVECLIEQGVEYVFGYPGGQIIDTFDALFQRKDRIKQILTAHEQGATHAADGYARVTGRTGVVMATSGPGATNTVTGIANAYMDSVPMVVITGNVSVSLLGRDSFQEVDIAGITMPVTKHNYIVKDVNALAGTIREAFKIAQSGRPGPVLIDVPKDVQQAQCEYEPVIPAPAAHKFTADPESVKRAVKIIEDAKKPLLYIGGGCIISDASKELKEFCELIDAPLASSMMGLGALPASHRLYLGMIGMHGYAGVARALKECDTVIAVGARFSDRVASNRDKFARHAAIVHIDIDNAEIDKNVASHAHIMGDVKQVLAHLMPLLTQKKRDAWVKECRGYVDAFPLKRCGTRLCARYLLERLNALTPPGQIIVTDVGQHQMWTAQSYRFERPRTFITSGGLGTMGFGLGAAIGAAFASKRRVCLISGDGSFHMNLNELATAVKFNLPVVIFVMNNRTLGMVRQWQTLFYGRRYSSTSLDLKTDYVKLAEAFGAKGFVLDADGDVDAVIGAALKENGPVLIECRINTDEFVLPMVPPGKSTDEIITDLE
ncbi:MAG: biosynthetic-type acetolactate synthase large subunit [Clostridiales bacterium]|jgi:acetolactate synthase-1/2/3 large subunit|nr:biosynthetic-type acetolactate synthase large subunit [Clostridiales bacterium]